MKRYDCILGGLVKHRNGGYGFKMTFKDVGDARKYKEMFTWMVKSDHLSCMVRKGYYDDNVL